MARSLGFGFSAAYNVRLTERVSLLPRLGLGFLHYRLALEQGARFAPPAYNGIYEHYGIDVQAELPVLVHFGQFFLGAGFQLSQQAYRRVENGTETLYGHPRTSVAFATTIGGWL